MKHFLFLSLFLTLVACGTSSDNQESEGTTTPVEEVAPAETPESTPVETEVAPAE